MIEAPSSQLRPYSFINHRQEHWALPLFCSECVARNG